MSLHPRGQYQQQQEERSEMGYEARMMESWTVNINNNQRDFCVKGDKFLFTSGQRYVEDDINWQLGLV